MRVGIIGTGAIAWKHAEAYKNIGYTLAACTNQTEAKGRAFAEATSAAFVATPEELARRADVDFLDVCTFPAYRLEAVELAARYGKHVLVQKPMAIDLATAAKMIATAQKADIQLGVVSQHRCDDSILFLKRALAAGRLGSILQADAYVKWYRSAEYYARPVKASWATEGGEDNISVLVKYASGATGVIQASTALWPGYPERIEIHGTKGSAIVTGDQLTAWDVQDDEGEPAPVSAQSKSGASDPLAISNLPFERQLKDFGDACKAGHAPSCSGIDGYCALQLVRAAYESCQSGSKVHLAPFVF